MNGFCLKMLGNKEFQEQKKIQECQKLISKQKFAEKKEKLVTR